MDEEGVQRFTLEKVGQTNVLTTSATDSLVYNVYALKEVGGERYLNGANDNFVLSENPGWAYAFKTVNKDEYQMFIYENTGQNVNVDIETGLFWMM